MFTKIRYSRVGFTLIELLISMTIISIMGAMTILVYFNVTENSRRLQMAREISETARQITERIAQDVRANGIFTEGVETDTYWLDDDLVENYKNGSNVLHIKTIKPDNSPDRLHTYYYGKLTNGTPSVVKPCEDADKTDKQVHCGLYIREPGKEPYNLVDAFRTEESKRVKITDLKFYITGDNYNARKVTLKMTLQLMPREGVPPSLIESSKLEIQTTFSERPYKIN